MHAVTAVDLDRPGVRDHADERDVHDLLEECQADHVIIQLVGIVVESRIDVRFEDGDRDDADIRVLLKKLDDFFDEECSMGGFQRCRFEFLLWGPFHVLVKRLNDAFGKMLFGLWDQYMADGQVST